MVKYFKKLSNLICQVKYTIKIVLIKEIHFNTLDNFKIFKIHNHEFNLWNRKKFYQKISFWVYFDMSLNLLKASWKHC